MKRVLKLRRGFSWSNTFYILHDPPTHWVGHTHIVKHLRVLFLSG